jgi:DNA-binding GntR family transcriptional regulator
VTALRLQGRRVSLADVTCQSLRTAITSLQLGPGSSATEAALSEQLGVSRPVLREALQRLQIEGLVEREGNGRLKITRISIEDVRQLYAVRSALDQLAVTDSVDTATTEDLELLEGVLGQMHADALHPGTMGIVESGAELYRVLYEVARNQVNIDLRGTITSRIRRYQSVSIRSAPERAWRSYEEHRNIIDAIARRDSTSARESVVRHLAVLEQVIVESIPLYESEIEATTDDVEWGT